MGFHKIDPAQQQQEKEKLFEPEDGHLQGSHGIVPFPRVVKDAMFTCACTAGVTKDAPSNPRLYASSQKAEKKIAPNSSIINCSLPQELNLKRKLVNDISVHLIDIHYIIINRRPVNFNACRSNLSKVAFFEN